ncbi:hypothetical protein BT96DRAFT_983026 [Gymnopus androsaceus JB14]|uniref:Xylanolytic transcriptional activator regulatory domain-containing protein n=1 Tax=Gymnopus androsaceus JB14 TaxID=1447944 RepID=A0A6A4IL89_9AGAR|nr:hypothetical protein BT96DRAFT_983026 [Gymnopus androsaceus JB14]
MSSDEAQAPRQVGWKKRRLQGACDNKRGPKSAYVERLEREVERMKEVLDKFGVKAEDSSQVSPILVSNHASSSSTASAPSYNGVPSAISSNPGYPSLASESPQSDSQSQDREEEEEDFAHVALADHLSKLSLNTVHRRFFGPSSAFMIMKNANRVKDETLSSENLETYPCKRLQYWGISPWEKETSERHTPKYHFPENDLLWSLISLYFEEVNIFLPILHGIFFKRHVAQGLHLYDPNFANNRSLVASRYSQDERVFVSPGSSLSSGWRYFEQVQMMRRSILEVPTLYELQFYCTSSPSSSWTLVAVGIRFAEELGIHRRQPDGYKWTPLDEEKRRAFWQVDETIKRIAKVLTCLSGRVLVSLDRLISSFVGRPSAIRDEDFDVDPPIECDDEYWNNPNMELSFQQPPEKPSLIACFNSHLRLCEILAFALRTLYSTKKSKLLLGLVGEQWEQKILKELDTALSSWLSSVPEHLRWNTMQQNTIFFRQSVFLYTMYYVRPAFRFALVKPSASSFHSLAVCTHAARCTSRILDSHVHRGIIGLPHILYGAFISAMVIMLNLWGSKRAGLYIDHQKELENAHKIMNILHACDQRWNIAGRFWDMLSELVRDFNALDHYQPSNKRARNADEPITILPPSPPQLPQLPSFQTQSSSTYRPTQSYPTRSTHSTTQPSADSQLASQLMYGWRLSAETSPVWTNQQTVESLSAIEKRTITYLEQIFGKIDNLPPEQTGTVYGDVDQGMSYQASNQGYATYPPQFQSGYEEEALDINGVNGNLWTSAPDGFDFDTWSHYVESMGLSNSNMTVGVPYAQ